MIDTNEQTFYRALEERFRGTRETIIERLGVYSPFLELVHGLSESRLALDLGCGRGEWLEILRERGFTATGVDLDDGMLLACQERGLDARNADALETLRDVKDNTLSIVTGFHIAEHLPFEYLQRVVAEAHRALIPGGILILETPNPENFTVSSLTFHLDPSHHKPLPPQLLQFLTEFAGFSRNKIMRLQESSEVAALRHVTVEHVLRSSSPDYSIVAMKASKGLGPSETETVFSREYGLSIDCLYTRNQRAIDSVKDELTERLINEVDSVKDELTERLINEIAFIQSGIASLANEISQIRQSRFRHMTKLLRKAIARLGWFHRGIIAWVTFRPGSRPRRIARQGLMRTCDILLMQSRSASGARWVARRLPRPIYDRLRIAYLHNRTPSPAKVRQQPTKNTPLFFAAATNTEGGEVLTINNAALERLKLKLSKSR